MKYRILNKKEIKIINHMWSQGSTDGLTDFCKGIGYNNISVILYVLKVILSFKDKKEGFVTIRQIRNKTKGIAPRSLANSRGFYGRLLEAAHCIELLSDLEYNPQHAILKTLSQVLDPEIPIPPIHEINFKSMRRVVPKIMESLERLDKNSHQRNQILGGLATLHECHGYSLRNFVDDFLPKYEGKTGIIRKLERARKVFLDTVNFIEQHKSTSLKRYANLDTDIEIPEGIDNVFKIITSSSNLLPENASQLQAWIRNQKKRQKKGALELLTKKLEKLPSTEHFTYAIQEIGLKNFRKSQVFSKLLSFALRTIQTCISDGLITEDKIVTHIKHGSLPKSPEDKSAKKTHRKPSKPKRTKAQKPGESSIEPEKPEEGGTTPASNSNTLVAFNAKAG